MLKAQRLAVCVITLGLAACDAKANRLSCSSPETLAALQPSIDVIIAIPNAQISATHAQESARQVQGATVNLTNNEREVTRLKEQIAAAPVDELAKAKQGVAQAEQEMVRLKDQILADAAAQMAKMEEAKQDRLGNVPRVEQEIAQLQEKIARAAEVEVVSEGLNNGTIESRKQVALIHDQVALADKRAELVYDQESFKPEELNREMQQALAGDQTRIGS